MKLHNSMVLALGLVAVLSMNATAEDDAKKRTIEKVAVGSTVNSTAFNEKVYFGGQPVEEDFGTYAELGVKTVINIRTLPETEALEFDEAKTVESKGMKYVQIEIGREEPDAATIKKLIDAIDAAQKNKVLIHCASSNRVGYAWSLYAGTKAGLSTEEALAEGAAAGMRAPQLRERAEAYLEKQGGK